MTRMTRRRFFALLAACLFVALPSPKSESADTALLSEDVAWSSLGTGIPLHYTDLETGGDATVSSRTIVAGLRTDDYS